jgi:1-acyl-sn-glycerol-3-phosphate acyltransferase
LQQAKSSVRAFFRNLRGVAFFFGLTINTIFWIVPVFLFAIVKLLLPVPVLRRAITRILMAIGENWVSVNGLLMRFAASVDLESRGLEDLQRDGWYLIISNHQTWVDIFILQAVFNRRVPFLKFFIKQQLIWFPLLGIAWWAMDMPFMKRFSPSYLAKNPHMKGKDLVTTRRACEKFLDTPTSILNFIEGTRFSELKRANRKSPYKNLLQPRAGGFAVALSSMGELFTNIVDVTMVYPENATSFWGMCCGEDVRVIVDVRVRELETWLVQGNYEGDREFRKQLHGWLGEIWTEKDLIIDATREAHGRQSTV